MNKQLVALVVFAACFSFTDKNAAHAFLPFDIISETVFVGGEVTSAIGQIIDIIRIAERNIVGNLTIFVRDTFLGQMDSAIQAAQRAISAIHNLQTSGLMAISKTLDNLKGAIRGFTTRLAGGAINTESSVTTINSVSALTTANF